MSPRTADSCPHDLRPGTRTCLHCRRVQRDARAARIKRGVARTTLSVVGFALCVGLGYVGATALKGTGSDTLLATLDNLVSRAQAAVPRATRESLPVAPVVVVSSPAPADPGAGQSGPSADAAAAGDVVPTVATTSSLIDGAQAGEAPGAETQAPQLPNTTPAAAFQGSATEPPSSSPPAAFPPVAWSARVPEGRTAIGAEGMYATREGETIRVHFDTELGRTRRPAKFEQIVRATLPAVFGPAADSLLSQLPSGRIASRGDLLVDLPARGVELRHADGRTLTVWPETRAGRDGPIVVAYRVAATR